MGRATGPIKLGILVIVLMLMGGCGSENGLEVTVPWADGEEVKYEIRQRGVLIGSLIHKARLQDGEWVLHSQTTVGEHREVVDIWADRESLVPRQVDFKVDSGGSEATYTAEYGKESTMIAAHRPDGPHEAEVRLPDPPFFDNEQFMFLLRSLPLAEDYRQKIALIVTRAASKTEVTVRVTGREEIETPLGTIEAWKVELMGAGQYGWVEVSHPHRVLRYENIQAETVTMISESR